jgi:hypothetical protein
LDYRTAWAPTSLEDAQRLVRRRRSVALLGFGVTAVLFIGSLLAVLAEGSKRDFDVRGTGLGTVGFPEPVVDSDEARALARRYQPYLRIQNDDGFWPVSLGLAFKLPGQTCLQTAGGCSPIRQGSDLPWLGESSDYLEYPPDDLDLGDQLRAFRSVVGSDAGAADGSARTYFLVSGAGEDRPVTLQYWWYWTFDYQPLVIAGRALPFHGSAGFHEGDFEGVGILLSAKTYRPVYLWTARHDAEGELFVFDEPAVAKQPAIETPEVHPVIYTARGSHASYQSCGNKVREQFVLGLINDDVSCDRLFDLPPRTMPLLDLARTSWACFQGRFGHVVTERDSKARQLAARKRVIGNGPRSPLWQQRYGGAERRPCASVAEPAERAGTDELPDSETAASLRVGAGRLEAQFDACGNWFRAPSTGVYLVACDPASLQEFFRSGLEVAPPGGLRIEGRGASPSTVLPAVLRGEDLSDLTDARITTLSPVSGATVFLAIRQGQAIHRFRFNNLVLRGGQRLRMRQDRHGWRLTQEDSEDTLARAETEIVREDEAPGAPSRLSVSRAEDHVSVRFLGPEDAHVTFNVYAAADLDELDRLGGNTELVRIVPAHAGGSYKERVQLPVGARYVRVVAYRGGQASAGAIVKLRRRGSQG